MREDHGPVSCEPEECNQILSLQRGLIASAPMSPQIILSAECQCNSVTHRLANFKYARPRTAAALRESQVLYREMFRAYREAKTLRSWIL